MNRAMELKQLKEIIRDVPDFPKKGIIFKDITTLLKNAQYLHLACDRLAENFADEKIDQVVSIESRGFIFGAILAYKLGTGFVPVRKKGKLPAETEEVSYELEYGEDILEIHRDAISKATKVLLVDDLLATGGTAQAVIKLIEKLGGVVIGIAFLIELGFLQGREKLKGYKVISLISY